MRYLLLIEIDPATAPSTGPDERLADAMGELLEEMTKAGVLLDTAGLRPIEEATRIRLADGKQTVTDGPFTESKEVIGGFTIFNLASREEALEEARGFMELHRVHWPEWQGEVEGRSCRVGLTLPRASRPGLGDEHGGQTVG